MSKNVKYKQYGVITLLVVICAVLIGFIYTSTQGKDNNGGAVETDAQEMIPVVEEIEVDQDTETENTEEVDKVFVEEIGSNQDEVVQVDVDDRDEEDENKRTEAEVIVVESIAEPKAEEPEKPKTTQPEQKPETDDDLTNPDVVPEYDAKETTYESKEETKKPQDEVRGSNLVPDSENPFLQDNIPSNGDGGEQQGSDFYQDGNKAGEGDKF